MNVFLISGLVLCGLVIGFMLGIVYVVVGQGRAAHIEEKSNWSKLNG